MEETVPRYDEKQKMSIYLDMDVYAWLWREKRRRERPIAWIVNNALKQYKTRLEKSRDDADDED